MELQRTNHDVMTREFATITADAHLKEAYEAIKKNLEGPPHSPGLIVLNKDGKYAGVLTIDDLMKELGRLYRDACDKPGRNDHRVVLFRPQLCGSHTLVPGHLASSPCLRVYPTGSYDPAAPFEKGGA